MTREQRLVFTRQAVERIRTIRGVDAVSPALTAPHVRGGGSSVEIPGTTPTGEWNAELEFIGDDYFRTVGVQLASGRLLTRMDVDGARPVAVVNRRFGQEFLGGADPIGRMVSFPELDESTGHEQRTMFEIIGVVGDTRRGGLTSEIRPQAYLPYTGVGPSPRMLLMRTSVNPLSLTHSVRRELAAINKDVALMSPGGSARGTMSLEEMVNRAAFRAPAFGLGLMATFAAVGLILSAIGVFSVMAYTVSLQTRDIGIRMALGAEPGGVVRMLLLKGLWPIAIGAAVGVGAAYGLSQLMANQILRGLRDRSVDVRRCGRGAHGRRPARVRAARTPGDARRPARRAAFGLDGGLLRKPALLEAVTCS